MEVKEIQPTSQESTNDVCQKDNTRTHHDITISELYDHQFLFCDPNVHRYIFLSFYSKNL